jgi:hypothetical protein
MTIEHKYLIDFWGGSHGHFLEYVINCWIFDAPRVKNLFTHTGACHGAKAQKLYRDKAIVDCGHFSQHDIKVQHAPDKIVKIVIDDFVGSCCYQINIVCRAGDIPKKNKEAHSLPADVVSDPVLLRMDYYSKFTDSECGYKLPGQWKFKNILALEINMSLLYDFVSFLSTLKHIAEFLDHTFRPDQELFTVWEKFIELNQGWQSWVKCNSLVKAILANQDCEVDLTFEQQALLNVLLSRTIGIFDGELFSAVHYPNNTKIIHSLIKQHLDSFDSKF